MSFTLLPEILMKHMKQSPILKHMFENVNHEKYIKMMIKMFSTVDSNVDLQWVIDSHRCYHITKEQSDEWTRCFELALNESCIHRSVKEKLVERAQHVIKGISSRKKCPAHVLSAAIHKYERKEDITDELHELSRMLHLCD